MARFTSGYSHRLQDLRSSETSCMIGDSDKRSDFAIATAGTDATPSRWSFEVDEQIEQSKVHWSTLLNEEELDLEATSNEEEFQALQRHPEWGSFFANFSGDGTSTGCDDVLGELVVGKKFAEGGQAELYHTQIKWNDPLNAEIDRSYKYEHVLKVFKMGTLLKHTKSQIPKGLLQSHVDVLENKMSPTTKQYPRSTSRVYCGILLKDGRFAFLMQKQDFDLRIQIERNMNLRRLWTEDCGPFPMEEAEFIMYRVAMGIDWLHNHDIVHRDVKASNVLVTKTRHRWPRSDYLVTDYECSVGVVGTEFFRSPEVLHACREREVFKRPEVFSRASDVYSYGMTCYEILTGKLPFEDHPLNDKRPLLIDLVINQQLRPEVPKYVEDWTRELLGRCWQFDPTLRPTIGEILNVLSANSATVRKYEALF